MEHIPENFAGKKTDITTSFTSPTRDEAADCFKRAIKRLQNPPVWHSICGSLSATFALIADTGLEPGRLATTGDYIRIDVPGPGTIAGGGYDWVNVEAIGDGANDTAENESFTMRLRASSAPGKITADTAHFFKDQATSTFIIKREGNTVTASYHGRNEVPNTDTASIIDNVRNSVMASGAYVGLSEVQWSALVNALLQAEL